MAKRYTQQQMQEHLLSHRLSEKAVQDAIRAAMTNPSHSTVVKFPIRQRLLVYVGHDAFELR